MKRFDIGDNESGQRLDRLISRILQGANWAQINKLFRKKCFKLNGVRVTRGSVFVTKGDVLEVFLSDSSYEALAGVRDKNPVALSNSPVGCDKAKGGIPRGFRSLIIHEDEHILAVSKPAGMLTHSAASNDRSDLTSLARLYLADYADRFFEPSTVSRLDRGTSGVVLFAKDYQTLKSLAGEMRAGRMARIYECIVEGELIGEGIIEGTYFKDGARNTALLENTRICSDTSDESVKNIVRTKYKVLRHSVDKKYTLVEAELITGKSHQIRVSLASIGFPIVGDIKYGAVREYGANRGERNDGLSRFAPYLHCKEVRYMGERYLSADADFKVFLDKRF